MSSITIDSKLNLNLTKICRLCLKENENVLDFIESSIADLIENCLSIKIYCDNLLPKNICQRCVQTINKYYTFKKQCLENEIILKSYFIKSENSFNEFTWCDINNLNKKSLINKLENQQTCFDSIKIENTINKYSVIAIENRITEPQTENLQQSEKPKEIKKFQKTCNDCFQIFLSRVDFLRHRHLTKHSKEIQLKEPCHLCGKLLSKASLSKHIKIHTKEKPYKCDICNQKFIYFCLLKNHQLTHTGERRHICEVCGQKFKQSSSLKNHQKSHSADYKFRPIKCNECGRIFKGTDKYEKHVKTHNPDYRISRKQTLPLDNPVKEVSQDKKTYLCTVCGKVFNSKRQLNRHSKLHTGEKPYKCDICEKSFAQPFYLIRHSRIHRDERPYQCQYCPKHFANGNDLKRHLRIHTGERPYKCTICGKSFAVKGNLNSHIRIHTKEALYNCDICEKTFITSSTRNIHKKIHDNNRIEFESIDNYSLIINKKGDKL